ncbi:MAG: D-alanyl-D-alanine carboxypeptidase/D-alanyl-D-alanine-endopeptidase [Candidatus Babeliales bacterium]|jgi:D-alanyl-D-alanine carboxypeptidase/D-alanyl-D-alanine-endopeptidase (penicillin-binding protein 4)
MKLVKGYVYFLYVTVFFVGQLCATVQEIQKSLLSPADTESIAAKIESIIQRVNPNLFIGLKITTMSGHDIYRRCAYHLCLPASTNKLIVAAAAFHYLGKDFTFGTEFLTDGEIKGDTLDGNIYLRGSGDPTLSSGDVEKMVKEVASKGIKKIIGALHIDAFAYDLVPFPSGKCFEDLESPLLAVIVDRNQGLKNEETIDSRAVLTNIGKKTLTLFRKYDISISELCSVKKAPEQTICLCSHRSEPLSVLTAHMLKTSDNLYADTLFKKVGAEASERIGSWKHGSETIKTFLNELVGINSNELVIDDGSGQSRYNQLTPNALTKLLQWVSVQSFAKTFLECLPSSGVDGTLARRLIPCYEKIKAKTGAMKGVRSLAGYIQELGNNLGKSL